METYQKYIDIYLPINASTSSADDKLTNPVQEAHVVLPSYHSHRLIFMSKVRKSFSLPKPSIRNLASQSGCKKRKHMVPTQEG